MQPIPFSIVVIISAINTCDLFLAIIGAKVVVKNVLMESPLESPSGSL